MIEIGLHSTVDPEKRQLSSLLPSGGERDKPLLHCIRCTAPLHHPIFLLDLLITSPQPFLFLNLQDVLHPSIWLSLLVKLSG